VSKPEVVVGQVVRVAEPDYRYGIGELILRVSIVGQVEQLADGPWLNLTGTELRRDGSIHRPQPRQALVRLSALRPRPGAGAR
jgi:hypothetical protein